MSFRSGTYTLTNVKAGVALDLSEGDRQSVIAFSPHGGPNQQWYFEDIGGAFFIRNIGLEKYLTFPGEPNDGKQVIATDGPRPWEVRVGNEGYDHSRESIRIFVPDTQQNLDLKDHGDPTAGNIVQLWERTPGLNQAWYFEPVFE